MISKYRGERVDNGEWVYGWIVCPKNRSYIILRAAKDIYDCSNLMGEGCVYEVHPDTVGQWTGESKWKEGERILDYYEGDIVECTLLDVNTCCDVVIGTGVITYSCAGFDVVMDDGTLGNRGRCNLQNIRKTGTIHDKAEGKE